MDTPSSSSPYISSYKTPMSMGGMVEGGDAIGTHANRAIGWLVAGIVALVVIVLIHMVASKLLGYRILLTFGGVQFENKTAAYASLITAAVVGFSVGGSVYEYWTGCKST